MIYYHTECRTGFHKQRYRSKGTINKKRNCIQNNKKWSTKIISENVGGCKKYLRKTVTKDAKIIYSKISLRS